MSTTSLFTAFLFFLGITFTQTTWEAYGLNGKVKSFTETNYKAVKTEKGWTKGEAIYPAGTENKFNETGKLITSILFAVGDNIGIKNIYEYNGNNFNVLTYNNQDELQTKLKIKHISENKQSFTRYDKNGTEEDSGILFYKNGRLVKGILKRKSNRKDNEMVTQNHYDKKGFLNTFIGKTKNGNKVADLTFKYLKTDEQDNWTKRLTFKSGEKSPTMISTREYTYY